LYPSWPCIESQPSNASTNCCPVLKANKTVDSCG
jgi:hypothetical protein